MFTHSAWRGGGCLSLGSVARETPACAMKPFFFTAENKGVVQPVDLPARCRLIRPMENELSPEKRDSKADAEIHKHAALEGVERGRTRGGD